MRLAILGSGKGSNLPAIVAAIAEKKLVAEIALVVSNKADAYLLMRAKEYGFKTQFVDPKGKSREAFDEEINQYCRTNAVDYLVLTGYMRILSAKFVDCWPNKMINVHPSLLPAFAGLMDLAVHQAVIDAGVLETGCTVHYVTQEVDAGPIILQKKCQVQVNDTALTLKTRVQSLEGDALVQALQVLSSYPH